MLLFLLACHRGDDTKTSPPPDLSELLSATESRAGQVSDTAVLMGGLSAEGRAGDFKIYNDRAQFVIQGVRESGYYSTYGGGLLDADMVRAAGEPGRDLVDEGAPMVGFGRILNAEKVEVINDGADGGAAVVRATGHGSPFLLLTGALETPSLVSDKDVTIITDYTLAPGSALLAVKTSFTWNDADGSALLGDLFELGLDVADTWMPGRGYSGSIPSELPWMAVLGRNNEVALAIFSDDSPFVSSPLVDTLQEAAPILAPLVRTEDVVEGGTYSWTRYVGVGRDLASLSDAWYAGQGVETDTYSGEVLADGAPVAGARVHLLDADGLPVTLAITDEDGRFSADLPPGTYSAVATGRGDGIHTDIAPGAGWYGPYAPAEAKAITLASLADGATPIPMADGYGSSDAVSLSAGADATLNLTAPAWLSIDTDDGLPAAVRVTFAAGDPNPGDEALVPSRPGGLAAQGFLGRGAAVFPVEPGDYSVMIHRGVRHEIYNETVSVASGETATIHATLAESYRPTGVLRLDGHSHASPSSDGEVPMEHRMLVQGSQGVDIHVGTDHDHVADYRVLLAPLGVDGAMTSVVADEVSPVLRGHFNAYPLEEAPDEPNNGAVRWWEEIVPTSEIFDKIRAMGGPDVIIQANHPAGGKGLFSFAGYDRSKGTISNETKWDDSFRAVEVLNAADYEDYLPFYLDLANRGFDITPMGVSDSHGYRSSDGISFTWINLGIDTPSALDNATLLDAMSRHATVVSRGPYIEATVDGDWAPGQTYQGAQTLAVSVWAPSWIPVDTLELLQNGEVIETVTLTGEAPTWGEHSFTLNPDADAVYEVIASNSRSMSDGPWAGKTPWAMTAAIRVDIDGDGWEAPSPPLTIE